MKITGLKTLSKIDIENKSTEVLTKFDNRYFSSAIPTPLIKLTKYLEGFSIKFNFKANLGFSDSGHRLLGVYNWTKKTILIDEALQSNEAKFNFTLAHEIGHLVLHRKLKFEDSIENVPDTDLDLLDRAEKSRTTKDWMEWQANYFAGCILMPKATFIESLCVLQKELGYRRIGKLHLDNQPVNLLDFDNVLAGLSHFFKVSKTAVEIRLKSLDLIDDTRYQTQKLKSIGDSIKRIEF